MRVGLLFNHSSIVGGGELSFLDLAQALPACGITPVVVVPEPGDVTDRIKRTRLETAFLAWPSLRGAGLLRWPGAVARAALLFREKRLDAVHANGARCMLVAGPAARRVGLPCLWHVRVLERDGRLDRIRAHFASIILANSRAVADTLSATGIPTPTIRVLYNGFPLEEWARVEPVDLATAFGLPAGPVILAAGRLTPWKRFEDLLLACRLLSDAGQPMSCVLAGSAMPSEQAYESELKRLASELGLGRLVFAGWRPDVPALMKGASVFALPSKAEPFGRVLVEAWACGAPLVATRAGGPAELVHDGEDGLLVPPENPTALAGAIRRILKEPGLAARLRAAGLTRAAAFNIRSHAEQVAEIYRTLTS